MQLHRLQCLQRKRGLRFRWQNKITHANLIGYLSLASLPSCSCNEERGTEKSHYRGDACKGDICSRLETVFLNSIHPFQDQLQVFRTLSL